MLKTEPRHNPTGRLRSGAMPEMMGQLLLLLLIGYNAVAAQFILLPSTPAYSISINANQTVAPLNHFWESTGLCPPLPHQLDCDWFLSESMYQNILLIGALPNTAIKQVRIHWLLDAVSVTKVSVKDPVYNFTCLDTLLDLLWQAQLKPGFELMGNPSNFFSDFENKTQVYLWKDLVHQIAARYTERYGLGYVLSWNFESWNEPKLHHFDGLNFTLQGFYNYYDACWEGLRSVSNDLRLGAPGGECHDYDTTSFCWATLLHVAQGTNYFTGRKGDLKLDFISIHKKGEETNNTAVIFHKEEQFLNQLKIHLPSLAHTAIFNDEADPLVGWSKAMWWRADATYAAMVTKVVIQHQNLWLTKHNATFNYQLLSNDNGFLSYKPYEFNQRTLLARFQINTTDPPHVQYIKKPVYGSMGLLSLLGDTQIDATLLHDLNRSKVREDDLGVLATVHRASWQQDSWQLAVMIYHSRDTHNASTSADITLHISNLPTHSLADLRGVAYQQDNERGNPYRVWAAVGKPHSPDNKLLHAMRQHEDPVRMTGPSDLLMTTASRVDMRLSLSMPGVWLLFVCARSRLPPDQVTNVRFHNITSNQVLITWSDSCVNTKCIKTFEVEYSQHNNFSFSRINPIDTFFPSFVYAPLQNNDVSGYYRVRAVDFWDRPGPFSLIGPYGSD